MALKEQIVADTKAAMKAKDQSRLTVLRGLTSVINNRAIEKRSKTGQVDATLSDEEIQQAFATEAKKRKESADVFTKGGRADLAQKEMEELAIIQVYLPQQLSKEATEAAVNKILQMSGAKEFGPAMKMVMAELRGKADATLITEIIKKKLG